MFTLVAHLWVTVGSVLGLRSVNHIKKKRSGVDAVCYRITNKTDAAGCRGRGVEGIVGHTAAGAAGSAAVAVRPPAAAVGWLAGGST